MGVPSDIRAKTNTEEMKMALYENNIRLKGFVGKDAATKTTASGHTFTVFSLATKSSYKDKQSGAWISRTDWHRIVSFGTAAKHANELRKGDYAEIEGELRSSEYDAETSDGKKQSSKRRSWEVRANLVRKLERVRHAESGTIREDDAA
jgi:single-strand DNA-binding protein